MHETKSKWFKKVLRATLCFLVVCGSLSAMLFVPNKEDETPQVPIEKELCVYSAPPQVSPTPTPISIEEEVENKVLLDDLKKAINHLTDVQKRRLKLDYKY